MNEVSCPACDGPIKTFLIFEKHRCVMKAKKIYRIICMHEISPDPVNMVNCSACGALFNATRFTWICPKCGVPNDCGCKK